MTPIDFGRTASDYATHRAGFPESFFGRLAERGLGVHGKSVVDLGTGTGSLARGFARRGCRVTGVDLSEAMLDEARRLDASDAVKVSYRVGQAEDTGLPAASADLVTAGQCWHWFRRDAAAAEATRLLKPDGHLVIAHFDWIPLPGNLVDATEQLILDHNPVWTMGGGSGLHPQWLRDLGEAGFRDLETFSYDVAVPYTHAAWRGRIRASAGVGAALGPEAVAAFDTALDAILAERFPAEPLQVPHRVFVVIGRRPAD